MVACTRDFQNTWSLTQQQTDNQNVIISYISYQNIKRKTVLWRVEKNKETEENSEVKHISSARREEERSWAGQAESGCWVGFQSKVLIHRPTLSENGNLKFDQNTNNVEVQNAWYLYIERPLSCPNFQIFNVFQLALMRTNVVSIRISWDHQNSSSTVLLINFWRRSAVCFFVCFFLPKVKNAWSDRWLHKHWSVKFLNCSENQGKGREKQGKGKEPSLLLKTPCQSSGFFFVAGGTSEVMITEYRFECLKIAFNVCCFLKNWREALSSSHYKHQKTTPLISSAFVVQFRKQPLIRSKECPSRLFTLFKLSYRTSQNIPRATIASSQRRQGPAHLREFQSVYYWVINVVQT